MSPRPQWTFITNHGAVLAMIGHHGQVTAGAIAAELKITERAVRRIIRDLHEDGYIQTDRRGRLNHYTVNHEKPLRRYDQRHTLIGDLLKTLNDQKH